MIDKDMLESAVNGRKRAGQAWYVKYLKGNRLTQKQAIGAKCYDCDGMGELGVCEVVECALYPYSPYRTHPGSKEGILKEVSRAC